MAQILGIVIGFLVTVLVTLAALWVLKRFKLTRDLAGLNAPPAAPARVV